MPDEKYIVDGSSLSDVADAIRSKTGESGDLIFPSGFVSSINNISSGNNCVNFRISGSTVFCDKTIYEIINMMSATQEKIAIPATIELQGMYLSGAGMLYVQREVYGNGGYGIVEVSLKTVVASDYNVFAVAGVYYDTFEDAWSYFYNEYNISTSTDEPGEEW